MFLIAQAKIQLLQDKLVCGSPTGRHHHSTGHLVILFVAAALHNTSERLEKKKKNKQYLFVGMSVRKLQFCSTCKSHALLWKAASRYCSGSSQGRAHKLYPIQSLQEHNHVLSYLSFTLPETRSRAVSQPYGNKHWAKHRIPKQW